MKTTFFEHIRPFYDDEFLYLKVKKKKYEQLYQKTRSVDLKVDFDLNTGIKAVLINNVLYGKCTSQIYALLKFLFGKEEQILPVCENKDIRATDFNKFFN